MHRYAAAALGLALMAPGLSVRGDDAPGQNLGEPRAVAPAAGAGTSDGAPNQDAAGNQPVSVTERGSLFAAGTIYTGLQGFVSQQAHEVGELSQQIDFFRAADNPDMVMVLYHMIRDHTLVKDAAQNVLARRGDVSRPVTLFANQPMPTEVADVIRHDIAMHEEMAADTQQALQNASSDEERSIYQHALNASQKHLNWLRRADQGQRLNLGYFGPTMPLSRIAGYREEMGTRRTTGRRIRGTRSMRYRR